MARKLTVTRNGKIIGKRTTDRDYTYVVAMTEFDADLCRRLSAERFERFVDQIHSGIAYAKTRIAIGVGGTVHVKKHHPLGKDWEYQLSQADYDSAAKYIGGLTDEEIVQREREASAARVEEFIAKNVGVESVLSWHSSATLAMKAQAAAVDWHRSHHLIILPVDGTK